MFAATVVLGLVLLVATSIYFVRRTKKSSSKISKAEQLYMETVSPHIIVSVMKPEIENHFTMSLPNGLDTSDLLEKMDDLLQEYSARQVQRAMKDIFEANTTFYIRTLINESRMKSISVGKEITQTPADPGSFSNEESRDAAILIGMRLERYTRVKTPLHPSIFRWYVSYVINSGNAMIGTEAMESFLRGGR